jgi:hypothetical protein
VVSFTLGETAPCDHCIGSSLGPRAGVDAVEYRKSSPYRVLNPGRPSVSPSPYELSYLDSSVGSVKVSKLKLLWSCECVYSVPGDSAELKYSFGSFADFVTQSRRCLCTVTCW